MTRTGGGPVLAKSAHGGANRYSTWDRSRPSLVHVASLPWLNLIDNAELLLRRADRLLAEVAGGDRRAFDELYEMVVGNVLGAARSVVRSPDIAEEVAHDVLVEVWQKAGDWSARRGPALGWIMMITRRRAIDRVRSEQASRDREVKVGSSEQRVAHDEAVERVVAAEERSRVREAMDRLSAIQRESLDMFYHQGMTQVQVADHLGLPVGTVKTRIRDGLTRLRREMREEFDV